MSAAERVVIHMGMPGCKVMNKVQGCYLAAVSGLMPPQPKDNDTPWTHTEFVACGVGECAGVELGKCELPKAGQCFSRPPCTSPWVAHTPHQKH